jgi:hypothetical protein
MQRKTERTRSVPTQVYIVTLDANLRLLSSLLRLHFNPKPLNLLGRI